LNRLLQKTYPDSTAVNYTYDNDSRLTQVTDPTGTYQFTFDNMGRLTAATTQYAFLTGRNFATSYAYDKASNRTGLTDPENGSTAYVYDTLNRLQTLTPPLAFSTGSFRFSYDALSRRTQMTRPNSVTTNYAYDNLSRLQSALHQLSGSTIDGASYTVDNAGNRTAKTDQRANVTSNYTYDPIYELTQVTQGANTTETYTYDPVGNRLSSLGVSSYNNNASNELTSTPSTTYTYDNNGNTSSKTDSTGTTNYAWDFENRLTSVALPGSGGTVSFKYDPLGRRIYKSSSSGTSVFAYDGDNLIEETNSSGAAVARYSQTPDTMDEPLAMARGGATTFYDADGSGSITSMSSNTGALAQTYAYDSFGKITASSGSVTNPFQYTAREFDSETSLYLYRARYYDQNLGRFLNEDPIGFSSGSYHLYDYVSGDPVNFNDPSGNKKIHGNWCGPNWTGGEVETYIPSHDHDGYYKDPQDYVDKVCSHHDRCYSKCRDKYPCSPMGRRFCERKCDFFLVGRLVGNPKDVFRPSALVVGLGITLNLVPAAGPNGGSEPTRPVPCCSGPPPAGAGAQ